jgi:hypothetical protein
LKNAVSSITGDDVVAFLEEFLLVKKPNRRIVVNDKKSFHFSVSFQWPKSCVGP